MKKKAIENVFKLKSSDREEEGERGAMAAWWAHKKYSRTCAWCCLADVVVGARMPLQLEGAIWGQ